MDAIDDPMIVQRPKFGEKPKECGGCPLYNAEGPVGVRLVSKNPVVGLWGMNPGRAEVDASPPEPFVGPAGKRLDSIVLQGLGLTRDECAIGNVARCFAPNESALPKEALEHCAAAFLEAEFFRIHVRFGCPCVALGRKAQKFIEPLAKKYKVLYFPMTHPSATLRAPIYEARLRQETIALKRLLDALRRKQKGLDGDPE